MVKASPLGAETPMAIAALNYAEQGFKVIPLVGKRPAIAGGNGYLDASSDPNTIRDWWCEYPDANIGLPMGPNGMVALDVDPRNGGDETLTMLIDGHGELPETACQSTGGGGWHYVFRNNNKSIKSPGLGIDIKDKGYIVVAPSIHPDTGKEYEWETPLDLDLLADPPEWLGTISSVGHHTHSQLRLNEDPVFHVLNRLGLVEFDDQGQPNIRYEESGAEKINVTCPWVHKHTDKANDGSAYFAGGGFKCHHAHCDHRARKDLLEWLREQGEDVDRLKKEQWEAVQEAQLRAFSSTNHELLNEPSIFYDLDVSIKAQPDRCVADEKKDEMPEHPDGLVGDIAKFTESTLKYKSPNIALATALTAVSRMIGNQAVAIALTGRKTPLNLYVVLTAPSGGGKETCRTVLNRSPHS